MSTVRVKEVVGTGCVVLRDDEDQPVSLIGVEDFSAVIEQLQEMHARMVVQPPNKNLNLIPTSTTRLIVEVPMWIVIAGRAYLNVPTEDDPLPVRTGMPIDINYVTEHAKQLAQQLRNWANKIDPMEERVEYMP